ncbi:MAG: HEPN domain-containing protein [Thermoproteota archaeon]|jgi:HEPN domain-containing protein
MGTFLKENAEYFEKKAKEAYLEKRYKFVLFFVEQSIQLYLKYILFKNFGEYPKTHKIIELINELKELNEDFFNFYEQFSDSFDLIEEAYITARYLDKEYSEKTARKALEVLNEFKRRFEKWLE